MAALATALKLNPSLAVAAEALQFCYEEVREAMQWSTRIARLQESKEISTRPKLTLKRWLQSMLSRFLGAVRCILLPQACRRNSMAVITDVTELKIRSMEEVWRAYCSLTLIFV